MKTTPKIAVYSGTRNIYEDMEVSARSLIAFSDVDAVYFMIEDLEFPRKLPPIVTCINVSDQGFFPADGPNMNSHFTYMAMMRACLAKLFPHLDRILSLDADTVCIHDVSDIWNLPIDGYYLSASVEPKQDNKHLFPEPAANLSGQDEYFNTGVALYNLDMLRDGKCDEAIDLLNTEKFRFLEQDVFNKICAGQIFPMPSRYNYCDFTERLGIDQEPDIWHFAGYKKFQHFTIWEAMSTLTWEDAMRMHAERVAGN